MDEKHKAIMEGKKTWDVYEPSYISTMARIDGPINLGRFSEIHAGAYVGHYVRIGMGCFICSGVVLQDYVFLGPRVTFCHDNHFPSGGKGWKSTLVQEGARIGAGAIILAGVCIGVNAIIGAGSVVTKDVPDEETWVGNPARKMEV